MTLTVAGPDLQWWPSSWRSRLTACQPSWPDGGDLAAVVRELGHLPDLVDDAEVGVLRCRLAQAAVGQALVVQAGECAERFSAVSACDVAARVALLHDLAYALTGDQVPAVVIGRIGGQYAKSRSAPARLVVRSDGVTEVGSYQGDSINGVSPDPVSRTPDPRRLLRAYHYAAATMSLLRAQAVADPIVGTGVFTSHEALILDYEEALTRVRAGSWLNTGTHLPWSGYRTRAPCGGHIHYLSGIANPVAVKVGPDVTPAELADVCGRLDPFRLPGRVTLIGRFGAGKVAGVLPALAAAVRDSGHRPVWLCDPMHGNTFAAPDGRKTRRVDDLIAEASEFVAALRAVKVPPAGLHLEVSADDVTECVGGPAGPSLAGLSRRYLTSCDPRLNPDQARFVTGQAGRLMLAVPR
jgi:3-deoxy-7-phosphoheptulonate synthase